jgi:hypothetical protein
MALIASIYKNGPKHGNGKISDLAVKLNAEAVMTGYNKTPQLVKTYKTAKPLTFTVADFVVAADTKIAA